MNKIFLSLLLIILLVSCTSLKAQDSTGVVSEPKDNDSSFVIVAGEKIPYDPYYQIAIEPESALDIWNMDFEDFGVFFEEKYPVEVFTYSIAKGTEAESTVYHIHSENDGPSIYISAGIHGNERAAWYAGLLMKNATISCGDLYVLSQANIIGAQKVSRTLESGIDPNRAFPGSINGSLTEKLAYSIFSDIEEKKPDLVLDLHEAILVSSSREFLGSTYIFTILDNTDFLIFDLLDATQTGEICHNEFTATGPGPKGSLNSTVSNNLGIPVITVETFRGFDIYRRVHDQLDTIEYVLKYYRMY